MLSKINFFDLIPPKEKFQMGKDEKPSVEKYTEHITMLSISMPSPQGVQRSSSLDTPVLATACEYIAHERRHGNNRHVPESKQ